MLNLANKITLLRILMAPLVVVLLYFEGPVFCILAALAFIFAAITDWMDGYIARRENMVTSMGKFLDPLADKVLICSVLIMFVKLGWAPAWVVIVIVCRELVAKKLLIHSRVGGLSALSMTRSRRPSSTSMPIMQLVRASARGERSPFSS